MVSLQEEFGKLLDAHGTAYDFLEIPFKGISPRSAPDLDNLIGQDRELSRRAISLCGDLRPSCAADEAVLAKQGLEGWAANLEEEDRR